MTQPINARAETAAGKPIFRHAFWKSRVLVPADYGRWLDPALTDAAQVQDLITPYPDTNMEA